MFFILLLLSLVYSKLVILSAGIGNYKDDDLQLQYNLYKNYKNIEICDTASTLLYYINETSQLDVYKTDSNITAEEFQQSLKNIGYKVYPTLYCDSTIGMCTSNSASLSSLHFWFGFSDLWF